MQHSAFEKMLKTQDAHWRSRERTSLPFGSSVVLLCEKQKP